MKKFTSLLLSLLLMVIIIPFDASATIFDDFWYDVIDEGIEITYYSGSNAIVNIPSEIDGYRVVSIDDNAFYSKSSLVTVTIPDGVINIGKNAFGFCENLQSVIMPDSVTNIGDGAFMYCQKLSDINIPENITNINKETFYQCENITNIIIPRGVVSIGEKAFDCCYSLSNIIIPEGVTKIGERAFSSCTSLTKINIPSSVKDIGIYAFSECSKVTEISLNYGVENIGEGAFRSCSSVLAISIPNSVKSIDSYTFQNCSSLKSITIPISVEYIGPALFFECDELESIDVSPENAIYHSKDNCIIETKSKTVVNGCNKSIIPDDGSVTSIGERAFYACKQMTSIFIPKSVTNIGEYAFSFCWKLAEVYYSGSEEDWKQITIDGGNSDLTDANIHFKYDYEDFEEEKFYVKSPYIYTIVKGQAIITDCDKTIGENLVIPSTLDGYKVAGIRKNAFYGFEELISVDIPDGVTYIGTSAFEGCWSLKKITIPVSIKKIKECAFYWCESLDDVYYKGSKADKEKMQIGSDNYDIESATWHYNSGSKCSHTYKTTTTKATLTKNGKIEKKCSVCGYIASTSSTIRRIYSVKLSASSYIYNGKVKTPSVTVKDSAGKTISSKYYTVSYSTGRKNVGTYKVTVKFKGNYSGTKTLYFKINPVKTTVSKLTPGKKSIKAYVTKKTSQVTGYQIYCSTSKSFSSNVTKKYITSYKTSSTTISGLSAKRTYYVKVRTYKTVNGTKYFSGWSTYKYTKTK